jgi:hypothetical protein
LRPFFPVLSLLPFLLQQLVQFLFPVFHFPASSKKGLCAIALSLHRNSQDVPEIPAERQIPAAIVTARRRVTQAIGSSLHSSFL